MRLLAILSLALVAALAHAADIGISPPRVALVGSPGETITTTVSVITTAGSDQIIAGDVGDWTIDIHGALRLFPAGTLAHGLGAWIALESDEMILPPHSGREVRVSITIPDDAEGTHNGMVFFTVVPPVSESGGIGVTQTARVAFTVYVTVDGTEVNGSDLVDLYQDDERSLTAVIVNTGNTVMRLGGAVELRDESGAVRHRLSVPDAPVLRESERELRLPLPADIEPGFYVALALIEDSRGGLLVGELPFDVP
jgi:hypothetical protein